MPPSRNPASSGGDRRRPLPHGARALRPRVAAIFRHTAGAISAFVGILLILPLIVQAFPPRSSMPWASSCLPTSACHDRHALQRHPERFSPGWGSPSWPATPWPPPHRGMAHGPPRRLSQPTPSRRWSRPAHWAGGSLAGKDSSSSSSTSSGMSSSGGGTGRPAARLATPWSCRGVHGVRATAASGDAAWKLKLSSR